MEVRNSLLAGIKNTVKVGLIFLLLLLISLITFVLIVEAPVSDQTQKAADSMFLRAKTLSQTYPYTNYLDDDLAFMAAAYQLLSTTSEYPHEIEGLHSNDAYGALVLHKSMCLGDSLAYKILLDKQGIPNYIATGWTEGKTPHAWNEIYYRNRWLTVDITAERTLLPNAFFMLTSYTMPHSVLTHNVFFFDLDDGVTPNSIASEYTPFVWSDMSRSFIETTTPACASTLSMQDMKMMETNFGKTKRDMEVIKINFIMNEIMEKIERDSVIESFLRNAKTIEEAVEEKEKD